MPLTTEQHRLWRAQVRHHRVHLGKTNHLRSGWHKVKEGDDGEAWVDGDGAVIWSMAWEMDGELWLHASIRTVNMPTYDDLVFLHQAFMRPDLTAYQLFVPAEEHVNIHPYVLHLWQRLTGPPVTPDFTRGTRSI